MKCCEQSEQTNKGSGRDFVCSQAPASKGQDFVRLLASGKNQNKLTFSANRWGKGGSRGRWKAATTFSSMCERVAFFASHCPSYLSVRIKLWGKSGLKNRAEILGTFPMSCTDCACYYSFTITDKLDINDAQEPSGTILSGRKSVWRLHGIFRPSTISWQRRR